MTTNVSPSALAAIDKQFGENLPAHKNKSDDAKVTIIKDKRSQAIDAVSNIMVVKDDNTKRKYAIALNATSVATEKDAKITEADPYLAELQGLFDEFLAQIRVNVEG